MCFPRHNAPSGDGRHRAWWTTLCHVTWGWWSSLWSFLELPENVGYTGLAKILPKTNKQTKTWMNFLANPILHSPTGCHQVLLGAAGSVEQRVLPRSFSFDYTVPVGLPLHQDTEPGMLSICWRAKRLWAWFCFFPRWVVRYWVAVFFLKFCSLFSLFNLLGFSMTVYFTVVISSIFTCT